VNSARAMIEPKVLLVEQDEVLTQFVANLVKRWGYGVRAVRDAGEALAAVQEEHPALILTDVNLPGLDGLQLTRALKLDPLHKSIPVIALHVNGVHTESDAIAAGCAGCVGKPIETQRLLALLRVLAPL
jgi:two-component system cell cycle response regulator DivK